MRSKKDSLPQTLIHASLDIKNSGDIYNAMRKAAYLDPEMSGKHIGLRFPYAMECEIYIEWEGDGTGFSISPLLVRDRTIRDAFGYDMKQPDVVIAPAPQFGYLTLYTLLFGLDFGVDSSVTFNFSAIKAIQLKVVKSENYKPVGKPKPWYARLFS